MFVSQFVLFEDFLHCFVDLSIVSLTLLVRERFALNATLSFTEKLLCALQIQLLQRCNPAAILRKATWGLKSTRNSCLQQSITKPSTRTCQQTANIINSASRQRHSDKQKHIETDRNSMPTSPETNPLERDLTRAVAK